MAFVTCRSHYFGRPKVKMNIPNLITLARLAAVPVIIWLILDNDMKTAFWVFFDRRLGPLSGRLLDPR